MNLDLFDHVKFLHPVGISTCKYGVTVPLEAQTARMLAIAKGEKVPVTILLGGDEPVSAEIRRLNNQQGHLQFRYEKKAQEYQFSSPTPREAGGGRSDHRGRPDCSICRSWWRGWW